MGKFKAFLTLTILCLFAVASLSFAEEMPKKPLEVGDKIESLELKNLEGNMDNVSFDQGGITAIAFFASSCSACRAELTVLNALKKQNKDLKVLALCVDLAGAPSTKRFAEQTKFGFDYYLDTDFKVGDKFGFSYTPGLVLVKGDGEIYFKKGGYMSKDEETIIEEVMKN